MTIREELLEVLTVDDLPKEIREVADYLGIEQFVDFVLMFSGNTIYVPRLSAIIRKVRNVRIAEEYRKGIRENEEKGRIVRQLASKHHLCERQVRNILLSAGLTD